MPVFLDSISFENPLDGTPVNWGLLNVGDPVKITQNISVKTFEIQGSSEAWYINSTDGVIGGGWMVGGDFSKFNIGDQVTVNNYVLNSNLGTAFIIDKLSNSAIQLNSSFGYPDNTLLDTYVISLMKPITALTYKWNFIENAEALNFYSKVDGSVQIASITNLNPAGGGTNKPMNMLGLKPYQIGIITVNEIALALMPVYASKFEIVHNTFVTPLMLDTQWSDIQAGISPSYFFNLKCLKPVFYYEARYFVNDPNNPQTLQKENILGNTGYFDENWNGNPTNYFISNKNYAVQFTGLPIPGILLDPLYTTDFSFLINNPIDNPFVSGSTKLILNLNKAPNDDTEYTGNTRDMRHNFVWDSVTLTVNTSPAGVDGDFLSDPKISSFRNVKAYYVSADKIKIVGSFTFDQQAIDVFEESDSPNYMLWCSIQDHTKQGAISDRVTLMVDAKEIYYQTLFPDLIAMSSKLIPHDVANYTDTYTDRQKFTEDELVGYTSMTIVKPSPLINTIDFVKFIAKIVVINTVTYAEFIVEQKTVLAPPGNFLNYPFLNIVQAKPIIHVPANEIRKNIVARQALGIGLSSYEFAYPFLNRWEYWEALSTVSSNFFNSAQPNNGLNEDWQHYTGGNYTMQYRFELHTKINSVPQIYLDKVNFPIYDRNLAGENTIGQIDTYDGATQLIDGSGNKYILGYKSTLVQAIFRNTVDAFDPTDTVVVIGIEVFEGGIGAGGVNGKRRMSSKYVSDSDTFFIPLTGETKVKLTFSATDTICTAETEIDFNSLNLSTLKWKLTARIYGDGVSGTHGTIIHGRNYLGDQNVTLIPTNPIDETTIVLPAERLNCCSDLVWRVLADVNTNEELKNDVNSFIKWYNKDIVDTAIVSLVQSDGTIIPLTGDSTYGTPYDYGFEIIPGVTKNGYNESAVAYVIDWKKILTELGEDTYYIQFDATTIFGGTDSKQSETYCLKQYTLERANGTVRIEYYTNGLLGRNDNDKKLNDYLSANWYNQHRFDGVFHYVNSAYKTDEIVYSNGLSEFVELEQTPEYTLKLKPIPVFKHDILRTDILMSDQKLITDYNTRNIDNYFQKQVINTGGYEPQWHPLQSKLASVELKFKQAFNNLQKFRS
ncbi:MAG: hypothetical protein V4538_15620 [Bacteroidota bacterium]